MRDRVYISSFTRSVRVGEWQVSCDIIGPLNCNEARRWVFLVEGERVRTFDLEHLELAKSYAEGFVDQIPRWRNPKAVLEVHIFSTAIPF